MPFLDEFTRFRRPEARTPATGLTRTAGLLVRGASLGLLGPKEPPETFGESALEFAGSIPTIAGLSVVTSPLVAGGVRALRVPKAIAPVVTRLGAAGATGGAVGGVEAAARGEPIIPGAAHGAAAFGAAESAFLGGAAALRAIRPAKVKVPPVSGIAPSAQEVVAQAEATSQAIRTTPETPPVQMQFPGMAQLEMEFKEPPPINVRDKVVPRYEDVARTIEEKRKFPMFEAGVGNLGVEDFFPGRVVGEVPPGALEGMRPGETFRTPLFNATVDPNSGIVVYTPKSEFVESAAERALISRAKQTDLPLGPEQLSFLQSTEGQGVLRKLDLNTQREPLLSSNVASQPEEVANLIAEQGTTKIVDALRVDLTPDGVLSEQLLAKAGIAKSEVETFMNTLSASGMDAAARRRAVEQFVRTRCP